MFEKLRVRGSAGSVLWGYRTAAELGRWVIFRNEQKVVQPRQPRHKAKPVAGAANAWRLKASVRRGDFFQLRQRPLYFTAPRDKGFWCFPILEAQFDGKVLDCKLGPPEQ